MANNRVSKELNAMFKVCGCFCTHHFTLMSRSFHLLIDLNYRFQLCGKKHRRESNVMQK